METGFPLDDDLEEEAGGYHALYWGVVVDNEDPQKLGRITAFVPAVTKKATTWAYPIGMPGSGCQSDTGGKGGFFVPRKKATVLVAFIYGKLEQPIYWCGHYPLSSQTGLVATPRIVQAQTKADAPNVRVLAETETFEIYITDTTQEKKVVLQTLGGANSIELDANTGNVSVKAKHQVSIDAPVVTIDGLNVFIKGRPVSPLGLAI